MRVKCARVQVIGKRLCVDCCSFTLSASFLVISYLNSVGHSQLQYLVAVLSSLILHSINYRSCFAISICSSSNNHSKSSSRPEAVAEARTLLLVPKSKPRDE